MTISFLRTIILYCLVIFSVRLMGKRQIGEMQPSELVVTLMISNIATMPMENTSVPVLAGVIPILTLVVIEIFLSYWMMNSTKVRNFLSGRPVVIVDDGKIIQKSMKDLRFTVDDFLEDLRKNGVFDISTVRYAIIETDGTLSILQKQESLPITLGDMNIDSSGEDFFTAVIRDGEISESSLNLIDKSSEWVNEILKSEKIKLKDIFIMTCDKNGSYNIIKKEC